MAREEDSLKQLTFVCIFVLLIGSTLQVPKRGSRKSNAHLLTANIEKSNEFWLESSRDAIRKRADSKPNLNVAKNVILFVGDGMGLTTLAAARNLLGGEEQKLSFEQFPAVGFTKIYAIDAMVPDAGAAATALLSGTKSNVGTVGVSGAVKRGDCGELKAETQIGSLAELAINAGKAAGFVTNMRITHAAPAAVYAHTAERNWESDVPLKKACGAETNLTDIAQQLVHGPIGRSLKVMLGGGFSQFVDQNRSFFGRRRDGRDLIADYREFHPRNAFVQTKFELENVNPNEVNRLLGLFNDNHLNYHLNTTATQPSLAEMTGKAIEFMQNKSPNGYFLFIEAGNIDEAHHKTMAKLALDETLELSKAVALAEKMTNANDTLLVVTADHSQSMSMAGYQSRGSDIFGEAGKGKDNQPYLPLSYANGPSFDAYFNSHKSSRRKPKSVQHNSVTDYFPATVPLSRTTHGGEDVPVFAQGPWAHLFTGNYEQNVLPHMISYAACLGPGLQACT